VISTKPPRCKWCKERTERIGKPLHDACVDPWYEANKEKLAKKVLQVRASEQRERAKVERDETKRRTEKLKSIKEFKADAQEFFNKYIRLRDANLSCVSCGETNPPMKPGGQWDAGHFLTRGAHPELAFDEDNCHKQCKSCNAGGGRFAHKAKTVNASYQEELLQRIGPERLARLKGPHEPKKWTREELIAIRDTYRNRVKELRKETA
jgi:hypothetical protein